MANTVYVIGGGISGVRTAMHLLERGCSVAIFESDIYPRPKLNCGILTKKAKALIDGFPEEVILEKVKMFGWYDNCRKILDVPLEEEIELIDRGAFDNWYLNKFIELGGKVYSGFTITGIDPDTKELFLNDSDGSPKKTAYESLVVACGVKSIYQFVPGEVNPEQPATAVCALINKPAKSSIDMDYGFLPGGRGFVVPFGNQTLVGVVGVGADNEKFEEYLYNNRIDRQKDENGEFMETVMYAVAPSTYNKYLLECAREWAEKDIFLTGEALGLTDPILGEGTYLALKSADLTAPQVYLKDLDLYEFSIKRIIDEMEEMFKGSKDFFNTKKPQPEVISHIIDHCLNLGDVPYNSGKVAASMKEIAELKKIQNNPKKMEARAQAEKKKLEAEADKKRKAKEARTKGKTTLTLPKVTGIPGMGKKPAEAEAAPEAPAE